jgi:hypothetical protein
MNGRFAPEAVVRARTTPHCARAQRSGPQTAFRQESLSEYFAVVNRSPDIPCYELGQISVMEENALKILLPQRVDFSWLEPQPRDPTRIAFGQKDIAVGRPGDAVRASENRPAAAKPLAVPVVN